MRFIIIIIIINVYQDGHVKLFFSDLKKQFESPPYSVSVEAGQSTELRCLPPVGVPPPRVYWLRNNIPVDTESDTLLVSSEGHLLIGQAKLSHQANYTCVAENIAAKRLSDPVSLTVYGKIRAIFSSSKIIICIYN